MLSFQGGQVPLYLFLDGLGGSDSRLSDWTEYWSSQLNSYGTTSSSRSCTKKKNKKKKKKKKRGRVEIVVV